jgi:hypothetical protein
MDAEALCSHITSRVSHEEGDETADKGEEGRAFRPFGFLGFAARYQAWHVCKGRVSYAVKL